MTTALRKHFEEEHHDHIAELGLAFDKVSDDGGSVLYVIEHTSDPEDGGEPRQLPDMRRVAVSATGQGAIMHLLETERPRSGIVHFPADQWRCDFYGRFEQLSSARKRLVRACAVKHIPSDVRLLLLKRTSKPTAV